MSGELTAEATSPFLVGFLTVVELEAGDYQGGYLSIDAFGSPVECRYTTSAVRPTLCTDGTLRPSLGTASSWPVYCGHVARKSGAQAHDSLDGSRSRSEGIGARGFPVAEIVSGFAGNTDGNGNQTIDASEDTAPLRGPTDGAVATKPILEQLRKPIIPPWRLVSMCAIAEPILEQLRGFDVWEPFERIKNVLAETRKAAVTKPDR